MRKFKTVPPESSGLFFCAGAQVQGCFLRWRAGSGLFFCAGAQAQGCFLR